jgi:hypothetical protein
VWAALCGEPTLSCWRRVMDISREVRVPIQPPLRIGSIERIIGAGAVSSMSRLPGWLARWVNLAPMAEGSSLVLRSEYSCAATA